MTLYLDGARYTPPAGWTLASWRVGETGWIALERVTPWTTHVEQLRVFGRVEAVQADGRVER